jgi:hypothetical protein
MEWRGLRACAALTPSLPTHPPCRLICLKNIFSKQLPNMPREYIARLVLDRRHRSVVLIKKGHVLGGITYRWGPRARHMMAMFVLQDMSGRLAGIK